MLLVTAAGNRTLTEAQGMLKPVIQRLMMAGKSKRSTLKSVFGEHQAIIDALLSRDRIAFSYHMDRHLNAGLVFISNATIARSKSNEGLASWVTLPTRLLL
ncbi:DNA-binding FadR family transcriptional regulator [Agrobacterium tumefaciens]|jgi:DNA-binding FadR family transcriptional regulator|nr:DNA-binding FadR family transcriptional regulator [Agrobacterium radiobacter]